MKRIFFFVLSVGLSNTGFGQAIVELRNWYWATVPSIDAPVYLDSVGGTRLNGNNPLWRVTLLGGPVGSSPAVLDLANGIFEEGNLSQGYYSGDGSTRWMNFRTGTTPPLSDGYFDTRGRAGYVVPGVDWGEQAVVQVVAWEGDFTFWTEAWHASLEDPSVRIGVSNPLVLPTRNDPIDPRLTYLWGLESFAIQSVASVVPEPRSFVLLVLAAGFLLSFRHPCRR